MWHLVPLQRPVTCNPAFGEIVKYYIYFQKHMNVSVPVLLLLRETKLSRHMVAVTGLHSFLQRVNSGRSALPSSGSLFGEPDPHCGSPCSLVRSLLQQDSTQHPCGPDPLGLGCSWGSHTHTHTHEGTGTHMHTHNLHTDLEGWQTHTDPSETHLLTHINK